MEINWKDLLVSFTIVGIANFFLVAILVIAIIFMGTLYSMFIDMPSQIQKETLLTKIIYDMSVPLFVCLVTIPIIAFALGSFFYFKKDKIKSWFEAIEISSVLGLLYAFVLFVGSLSLFSVASIEFSVLFPIITALIGGSFSYFLSKRI